MKKLLLLSLLAFYSQSNAQNVGIGNPSPAEKLDVTGNINVTGTIKANGTDGAAGQVLQNNGNGTMIWGNLCDFKNFKVYEFTTVGATQTFTVPAGVTKIKAQLWGGGGASGVNSVEPFNSFSGSGGGYAEGELDVLPLSTINIIVSNFNNNTMPTPSSTVTQGANSMAAFAGKTPVFSSNQYFIPEGGNGVVLIGNFKNFISEQGQSGKSSIITYFQAGTTLFYYRNEFPNGGDCANTNETGGQGGAFIRQIGVITDIQFTNSGPPKIPGGGASPGGLNIAGATGRVIIS